jgi:hypothetical protein
VTENLGDIFGGGDLLGSVIRGDRRRAGREPDAGTGGPARPEVGPGPAAPGAGPTGNPVIPSYDTHATGPTDTAADQQAVHRTSQPPDDRTRPPASRRAGPDAVTEAAGDDSTAARVLSLTAADGGTPFAAEAARPRDPAPRRKAGLPGPDVLVRGRVTEARRLAASPTVTVTLRVPKALNDWLDEYVHRSWPERVRKQELVAEALRLAFARRGRAGEPVIGTDLLSEDDE